MLLICLFLSKSDIVVIYGGFLCQNKEIPYTIKQTKQNKQSQTNIISK